MIFSSYPWLFFNSKFLVLKIPSKQKNFLDFLCTFLLKNILLSHFQLFFSHKFQNTIKNRLADVAVAVKMSQMNLKIMREKREKFFAKYSTWEKFLRQREAFLQPVREENFFLSGKNSLSENFWEKIDCEWKNFLLNFLTQKKLLENLK